MSTEIPSARNWFDQGGRAYARFRPEYPPGVAAFLASEAPDKQIAVDVGCGNGQLTQLLAPYFARVIGLDPSADQIANVTPNERINYQCAPAEQLPLADKSVSLITAAQAAHWFNLPAFYQEVRRIGISGAILALISYGVLKLEPGLNDCFQKFYYDEIGPYWPLERKLVDTGYTTINFPFEELTAPSLEIHLEWNLFQFLGYLLTWSAVQNAKEAGKEEILMKFANNMAKAWGNADLNRAISWPINMRIGRL
ncbi:class I SAM-dependent methyltransferase [Janthinobacterium sp. 17J80-10]|uniref:class I SAM-dependent methyltransferase n=1 Tax=Janthinobacterium sp. 17J80-10 TaxID=2497863 RepID=UPI0010059654|nr:class I SAM-dependent methyltransferase [Janthinobacterium sp. 17J80-10]QAU35671.1 class I SAM-dependent methyltransferase [Janthinobacterium sp. 17J80-10]